MRTSSSSYAVLKGRNLAWKDVLPGKRRKAAKSTPKWTDKDEGLQKRAAPPLNTPAAPAAPVAPSASASVKPERELSGQAELMIQRIMKRYVGVTWQDAVLVWFGAGQPGVKKSQRVTASWVALRVKSLEEQQAQNPQFSRDQRLRAIRQLPPIEEIVKLCTRRHPVDSGSTPATVSPTQGYPHAAH